MGLSVTNGVLNEWDVKRWVWYLVVIELGTKYVVGLESHGVTWNQAHTLEWVNV